MACAQLQIRKLHRPPREPQPGGLIERFFQTVQSQFESEVRACRTMTLTLWVWVTYDPFAHGSGPPEQVEFWSEQGVYLGVAPRYERQRGAHEPITAAPPPTKLEESAYLRALQVEAHQQQQAARQDGINFHSAMTHERLTNTGLCQMVARLLGHKGGLSAFTPDELQALQQLHRKYPHILQTHVRTAFERVTSADFTSVLWELQQQLADTKGTD